MLNTHLARYSTCLKEDVRALDESECFKNVKVNSNPDFVKDAICDSAEIKESSIMYVFDFRGFSFQYLNT